MTTITVSTTTDGLAISFDPARILRVTRGVVLPTRKHLKTEVTLGDPDQIVFTDESMEQVLAKVGKNAPMVNFTAPDNSLIAINAKEVTGVREPNPSDLKGVPGLYPGDRTDPIVAHAELLIRQYLNFVKETVREVETASHTALA
jgi:hypothetical protein